MKIHVGFDLTYESALSTPMIFMLNVHPSRAHDLITPDRLRITPSRAISPYIDGFGNKCVRILRRPASYELPAIPSSLTHWMTVRWTDVAHCETAAKAGAR